MTRSYSIAEAKNCLPRLVHDAEEHGFVEITRRGKPVAVVVSIDELQRLRGPRKTPVDVIREFRSRPDFEEIALEGHEFDDIRDRSPGRDFSFE